jgi:hypothetical protein
MGQTVPLIITRVCACDTLIASIIQVSVPGLLKALYKVVRYE